MAHRQIRVRATSAALEGKCWESDTVLRIGRQENLEIVLDDPSVSRRHAEAVATEEGWVIRDLGSLNGTFINEVRIGRADRRILPGDTVQCGNLSLLVVSIVIFSAVTMLPGNFATAILGQSATPETVAAFKRSVGLDKPPVVRYFSWIGGRWLAGP